MPGPEDLKDLGYTAATWPGGVLYRPKGCPACLQKGYRGRTGIFELLLVDDEVRALVTSGADAGTIKRKAIENGMKSLRDDGIRNAMLGVTSVDEVMRVTQVDVIELD